MLGFVGQEPAPSKCVLMSTSRAVRGAVRGWVVSDEGHRWSVKLDVRDLGVILILLSMVLVLYLGFSGSSCHFSVGSCLCSPVGLSWAPPGSSFHVYSWCFAWY